MDRDPVTPDPQEAVPERRQSAHSPPEIRAEPEVSVPEADEREGGGDRSPGAIRAEDTEPYFALQYVARLFKIAALVVMVALVAEIVAGLMLEGLGALLPLIAEIIRGLVLAAILWGAGDLTVLLIDVGHDVRAARVLLGRLSARAQAADPKNPEA